MNLTKTSIRRPVTTLMVFLCIAAIGGISIKLLPMEFFPDIDAPFVGVDIPYPGSTPEEVEREITRSAEEVLATISDIKNMRSWSNENNAYIHLEFDWGVDTDIKALKAREKIDGIRHLLPDDVERIFIRKWSSSDEAILTIRLSSERDLSNAYDMLNRNLVRRIERLDGISKVELYGVEKKEIRIKLDVDRLAAHKVDINRLVTSLRRSNFAVTSGRITDGYRRLSVRPIGTFKSAGEYENIIVGDNNLRLADVADVTYQSPKLTYGRHLNRKYAIGLDVYKEGGSNTVDVTQRILDELEEIKKNPEMAGITIYEMDNQAEGILSSLNELFKSGMLGAFLATMVLYFFLRRWSTTFMVTLAVPFSLLVTLACMYFLGISLNILSMMGLMLAVGMLVDNAVVAVESIHRYQHMEADAEQASIKGIKEIALAITAGTFTTIIVFLPNVVNADDDMAVYLKHVSIALCISMAASLLIAQSIVPLFTSKFKTRKSVKKTNITDRMIEKYASILGWTLNHRGWSVTFIFLVLLSVMIPGKFVKFDMFPDQQRDRRLRLHYNINDNYTLAEVEKTVDLVEDYLYKNQEEFEIESVYSYYQTGYASSTILLTKDDKAFKSQKDIQEAIRKDLPVFPHGKPGFEHQHGGGGNEAGVRVQLIGKSSEELIRLSHDISWLLSKIPGLIDVRSEAEAGEKEIQITVDRKLGSLYGISTRQAANVVSAAIRGVRLSRFRTREGEVDVKLEFQETDKQNLAGLQNLPLFNDENQMFKLTSIADFKIQNGPQSIRRDNRVTSMGVIANMDGLTSNEAREKIREVMNRYKFPPGYNWNFGQRFNFEDEAAKSMITNMLLALALIYFVMAALFESLVFPAGIWSSIFFSIVGVYWFFLITGTIMSMMAMIGILILIGVVVNNGIVLVDHIIQLRSKGLARNDAILQAGKDRLRPIIMTAATTVFSLLPLTMVTTEIGGSGGPPYFPMARAIVGGLTFSTFVTLLILPTIYILLDNLRNWAGKIIRTAS